MVELERPTSIWVLNVHRDHKDYLGRGAQDNHLDFYTARELCDHSSLTFSLFRSPHKGVNQRSKYVAQMQQQTPESPTVTLTWHACKYKVPREVYPFYFIYIIFTLWPQMSHFQSVWITFTLTTPLSLSVYLDHLYSVTTPVSLSVYLDHFLESLPFIIM